MLPSEKSPSVPGVPCEGHGLHLPFLMNHPVSPLPSVPEENWEVPITGSPLGASHASCFEAHHATVNDEDSYEVPMVPLDSVCDKAPPHIPPPSMEAETNHNGFIRDCQVLPGLARVTGRPPFQMWEAFPLQQFTVVCSMRSNQQQARDQTGHGWATTEQT